MLTAGPVSVKLGPVQSLPDIVYITILPYNPAKGYVLMKDVLIIDQSMFLRDFLRHKLSENDFEVTTASGDLEAISKIRNGAYDLIILDYYLSGHGYMEILKQKKANPNTRNIPVILFAPRLDQEKIIDLLPYNVKKVFTRPVHIAALFATIAEFLKIDFKEVDKHPSIVEAHVNDDIIFIEISKGLNHDKLDLLHYKIAELINLYEIQIPKIIVMLTGMKLNFANTPDIQRLLEIIVHYCKGKSRFMRVLTKDSFVKKYIEDQKAEYGEIQVVPSLLVAVEGLISELGKGDDLRDAEILGARVLATGDVTAAGESLGLRFNPDESLPKKLDLETLKESIRDYKIAVVDDDFVIQELLKNTFQRIGLEVSVFFDGEEFLAASKDTHFDLVFLDLIMPKLDGFGVLDFLSTQSSAPPVIILSSVTNREAVIRAFKLGIKGYLTKPIKPTDIFRKAIEILSPDF
jgi:DNA-binding response OmpR family regulator